MRLYLDSSALVKLVVREEETQALRRYLGRHAADARVTAALSRVEVVRAVSPGGTKAIAHAHRVLGRVHQVRLDDDLLDAAGRVGLGSPTPLLRSLDAIHLAAAQLVGEIRAVVTYDRRMSAAAAALGLATAAPA